MNLGVVLQRSAGEQHAMVALVLPQGRRQLAVRVLQPVRLVDDEALPLDARKVRCVRRHHLKRGDHHLDDKRGESRLEGQRVAIATGVRALHK